MIIKDAIHEEKHIATLIKYQLQKDYSDKPDTVIKFWLRDYSSKTEEYKNLFRIYCPITVSSYIEKIDTKEFKNRRALLDALGIASSTVELKDNQDLINVEFTISDQASKQIKTNWNYVHAIADIVNNGEFRRIFENNKTFASIISTSPASITKYVKVSEFLRRHQDTPYVEDVEINSLYKLTMLYKMQLQDFVKECGGYKEIAKMSDKQFCDAFDEFRKSRGIKVQKRQKL